MKDYSSLELKIFKEAINELGEWADHWKYEAESFDHPAMQQERNLSLQREKDVRSLIKRFWLVTEIKTEVKK